MLMKYSLELYHASKLRLRFCKKRRKIHNLIVKCKTPKIASFGKIRKQILLTSNEIF